MESPKTFSQCLGEFFRSDIVDCGESQQGHVVERHGESFQQEVQLEQNRRRAQSTDMRRFGEPWTPKRLMRRGQIGRRLRMKHLLLFRRRFEAEGLAPNGRKKTSYLMNAEIETCPGSK